MGNLNHVNLTPNVRTIGVAGGTGDGKSEITSTFASPRAKKIIGKSVGETNSTLKERVVVYSEALVNEIIVAVKLRDDIFERQDFIDLIVVSMSKVVRDNGKIVAYVSGKANEDFITFLLAEITTKVNSRAILSFLTVDEIDKLAMEVSNVLENNDFYKNSYSIYNTAKNNLGNIEVKDNSAKLFGAIRSEVEKSFDQLDKNILDQLWDIWNGVNHSLKSLFFNYFQNDDISNDGYYYYVINLDEQESSSEFVDAMFTSNDLRKGDRLSIEVLCSEIVMYTPIHEKIAEMIKSKENTKNVFMGKDGKIAIGIYDTRGLYHTNSGDEDNFEYFTELLYGINYDALMLVCPLTGDTNEAKLRELYSNSMKKYNKQIPVFILNNKVDLFIDALNKELSSEDPLSIEVSNEVLSFNEIKKKVNEKMATIREELQKSQHKNRKSSEILSLPCYLKKDNNMTRELLVEYNTINAIRTMVEEMTQHLQANAVKIKFVLSNSGESNILPCINEDAVKKLVLNTLALPEIEKKIFEPSLRDIADSVGKTPHGNAYNALRRRLKNGNGYTSNIIEEYFYNCKSFSVNFPGNLKNFVTKDFISKVLDTAVEYKGGVFKVSDGNKRLNEIIINSGYFNPLEFVAQMLYFKALMDAENQGSFSFGMKFNRFLNNCNPYFNKAEINEGAYIDAIIKTLSLAINKAADLHVLYV